MSLRDSRYDGFAKFNLFLMLAISGALGAWSFLHGVDVVAVPAFAYVAVTLFALWKWP